MIVAITLPRTPGLSVRVELPERNGELHSYTLEVLAPCPGEAVAVQLTQLDRDRASYGIVQDADGGQRCGCWGWRRWKRSCKHLEALRDLSILDRPA